MRVDQAAATPTQQFAHPAEIVETISQRAESRYRTAELASPALVGIRSTQTQIDDVVPSLPKPCAHVGGIERIDQKVFHGAHRGVNSPSGIRHCSVLIFAVNRRPSIGNALPPPSTPNSATICSRRSTARRSLSTTRKRMPRS